MPQQYFMQGMTGDETFEQWFNKTNEIIDFTNDNSGLVKIEIDYSGKLQPSVANSPPFLQFTDPVERAQQGIGIEVGQPIFSLGMPTENFQYTPGGYDFVHCNLIGRLTGVTGTIMMTFTDWGDGWGGEGAGATDGNWQRNLFGLIAKIHSWDTTNKKIVMDVCRPGGHFTVKYSDLNTFNNRNFKWYHENVLNGGDFFLGIPSDRTPEFSNVVVKTGLPGGFFQITPFTDSAYLGIHTLDGANYLSITPYNDPEQHLRIYLDPRAPLHKYIPVTGLTAAKETGSAAILGNGYFEDTSANTLVNLSIPDKKPWVDTIINGGWYEYNINNAFSTPLVKITCLLQGQTYSRLDNTALVIVPSQADDISGLLYEGSNFSTSVGTNGICDGFAYAASCPPGNFFVGFCGRGNMYIVNKMGVDVRMCVTSVP